jgi:hypothetical protein
LSANLISVGFAFFFAFARLFQTAHEIFTSRGLVFTFRPVYIANSTQLKTTAEKLVVKQARDEPPQPARVHRLCQAPPAVCSICNKNKKKLKSGFAARVVVFVRLTMPRQEHGK